MKNVGAAVLLALVACGAANAKPPVRTTWMADNGNGTYTNPLFYDEFSDPDMIRVGDDYYLTGTSMHSMPGLPILHSKDLVNWDFVAYAEDKLDLGPAYRLEGGNVYGQGIWAPSFRYHDGTYYIFSNVNHATTQLFTAKSPKGPWTRTPMKKTFHDLSVLFDDDGKVYVVWGYQEIHLAELDSTLTDIVPGSEQIIIPRGAGMGEGSHFYKWGDTYWILSAEWNGMRMAAARSKSPLGPYEVNRAVSVDEDWGQIQGYREDGDKPPFKINPPDPSKHGWGSLHQGGVLQTQNGDWWGWSMYDSNSVGRLTALSPVTWKDGWPYFGLPGNLTRTPRVWTKPNLPKDTPHAPYERSSDFSEAALKPVWQWNHVPVDAKWSLTERPGYLRLHALPATDLLDARDTLTQRVMGPRSTATVAIDVSGLKAGDVTGLSLFNRPYGWIGVEKTDSGLSVMRFDEQTDAPVRETITARRVWLRADCDFLTETHGFSWSTDGKTFHKLGAPFVTPFQLKTFQGVRYGVFAFNRRGHEGGVADIDSVTVHEPDAGGLKPIPFGRTIDLKPAGGGKGQILAVADRGLGRVALLKGKQAMAVQADGSVAFAADTKSPGQTFQWMETLTGEIILMSLETHRYLRLDAQGGLHADSPGPLPDGKDGVRFTWMPAK